MPWVTVLGFLRIVTHRAVSENPMPVRSATGRVRSWLSHPNVKVVTPGEAHGEVLFRLLEQLGTGGNLTTDAHLAALAIEYQAELATTDSDFSRFEGLRWFNPLAAGRAKR
jgi:toxin-antitoxin system PIN domain toxin